MYQKDGYYYLLAADSGTFGNHQVVMARSRDFGALSKSTIRTPYLMPPARRSISRISGMLTYFRISGAWWAVALGVRMRREVERRWDEKRF